jgi:hypothetical protein
MIHHTHTLPLSLAHAGPAHTTRTSPGPLGPSFSVTSPSGHSPDSGAHRPPSGPPRRGGNPRPPWTWATATGTGHLPTPPACPKQPGSPHQPQALSHPAWDSLSLGHGILATGPLARGSRPDVPTQDANSSRARSTRR